MSTSIEEFRWLASQDAAPYLADTMQQILDKVNVVRIAKSLRKDITAPRSALVLELAQLRIRARRKFKLADQMFFTKRGLQQSTSRLIAEYKAVRFAACDNVADICCSIGGDLISLAGQTMVTGFDIDAVATLYAQQNIEVYGLPFANVFQTAFEDLPLSDFDGFHLDPDRRSKGRTVQGDFFEPSLPEIFRRLPPGKFAAVKVAPATPWHDCIPADAEREWIGVRRECKQQVIWTGAAVAKPGHLRATRVSDKGKAYHFLTDAAALEQPAAVADAINDYLYEPHSTILAGQMTNAIANRYDLKKLATDMVYLTGDEVVKDRLLRRFQVEEIMPIDPRKIAARLKEMDVGRLEIKLRGVHKFLTEKFERLKLSGNETRVLFLTRHRKTQVAIIAKRDGQTNKDEDCDSN